MIRALTGLLAMAAVAITVVVLDPAPEAQPERTPASFEVVAADLPSACPGWLELPLGEGDTGAGGFAPGSTDVHRETYVSGTDTPIEAGSGFSTVSEVATAIERIGGGDLSGLAAATCIEPRLDTWLVGGSTGLGESARLVLVNPTAVESDVVVTIYGPSGVVGQQVYRSIGAESSESILLEGIAAGLATLAVHVEATGAGVVAMIQDSRLDGFVPAGSEWVTPAPDPSTSLVIVGVGPSDPEGFDGAANVRLMAPEGATVSLKLADASGTVAWAGTKSIHLEPGVVADFDVPLSGMSSVIVESDRPVVAAALAHRSRVTEEGLEDERAFDIVWVAAQVPGDGPLLRAVTPPYTVTLVAYAEDLTTLTVVDLKSGQPIVILVVGAGTTTEVPLNVPPGTVVGVRGTVSWVLRVSDGDVVTAIQPIDIADHPATFTVMPGNYIP